MSVKLRISVTKEILELSKDCDKEWRSDVQANCAIALAVRDIFPDAQVEENGIFLTKEKWERYPTPPVDIAIPSPAKSFIRKFDLLTPDERLLMKPFSFEIIVPVRIVNSINIGELKPLLQNHPTLELIEA